VRKGGEVVLVGVPWRRRTETYAHDLLHAVFHNYVVLRSGWEWELPRHSADFQPASIQRNLATALQWLAEGRVSVQGLYSAAQPAEAQEAYQAVLTGDTPTLATAFLWG
jgi:threonine dehydrogenase-like Zn-dependent dehydrogenase